MADTKFVTRQEVIKEIKLKAYKQAVKDKRLKTYKFAKARNSQVYVKRNEYDAFIESCRVE